MNIWTFLFLVIFGAPLLLLLFDHLRVRMVKNRVTRLGGEIIIDDSDWYMFMVNFQGTKITDDALIEIRPVWNCCTDLILLGTDVTDRCIQYITKIPDLGTLDLSSTGITGRELSKLVTLRRLYWLSLCDLPINDIVLEELARIPNLTRLILHGTSVTSDGMNRLLQRKPELIIEYQQNRELKGTLAHE